MDRSSAPSAPSFAGLAAASFGVASSEPPPGDEKVLQAVRDGDEKAAETLYRRLYPSIEHTVRHLLGAKDADFADCVQMALVEIVRAIGSYRGECSFDHWSRRVTAHVVYKHIRRRQTERKIFERGARTSDRPEPVSAQRRILARDLAERVREKLDSVGQDKAYAFLLHDLLGFELKEIAQITSVSVAAAQQRLLRGRRELFELLSRDSEMIALLKDWEDGA